MATASSFGAISPGSTAPVGRRFGELRASDFADRVGPESILVLPVGAVEQHGRHLPFSTDLIIADASARAVVAAAGDGTNQGEGARGEMGMGIHAGFAETSIMLHLRPDLVAMDRAEPNVPAHLAANDHVRFGGAVTFGWLASDFGPTGVIGDPTQANAETGGQLFKNSVEHLIEVLAEIARFRYS